MSKRKISTISILLSLFVYIIFYRLVLIKEVLKYSEIITACFILVLLFITFRLLGFQEDKKTRLKQSVFTVTVTQVILYFALTYALGIIIGFLKNSYSLTPISVLNNMFAPAAIIVCVELFRYIVITTNRDSKKVAIMVSILLALLDIAFQVRVNVTATPEELFRISTLIVLPCIVKHAVMSYLTYTVGFKPCLVYRLVVDLSIYVLPIVPDLGDYLKSITLVALPFLIFLYSSRIINEYNVGVEHTFQKNTFKLRDIPLIILFVVLACLISGFFPYYMIGVGSGSMKPTIDKGDAVIIHKVKEDKELKEGEVIAFRRGKKMIVHRIVEIVEEDGVIVYHTKGDYNNSNDRIDLTINDIIGTIEFRIPKIAYPAIFISDFLERDWR